MIGINGCKKAKNKGGKLFLLGIHQTVAAKSWPIVTWMRHHSVCIKGNKNTWFSSLLRLHFSLFSFLKNCTSLFLLSWYCFFDLTFCFRLFCLTWITQVPLLNHLKKRKNLITGIFSKWMARLSISIIPMFSNRAQSIFIGNALFLIPNVTRVL